MNISIRLSAIFNKGNVKVYEQTNRQDFFLFHKPGFVRRGEALASRGRDVGALYRMVGWLRIACFAYAR